MNYIDAETFLKQSKEVQKVLTDWWKPEMYDLFFRNFTNANGFLKGIYKGCIQDFEMRTGAIRDNTFLPLLSETQLRHFIEDKTSKKVWVSHNPDYQEGHSIIIQLVNDYKETMKKHLEFAIITDDLLKAYWEVACKIAQEVEVKCLI